MKSAASLQAATGDSVAAEQAFGRMRAAGAWDSTDCAFPNVLLDAYGGDVQSAIHKCGASVSSLSCTHNTQPSGC